MPDFSSPITIATIHITAPVTIGAVVENPSEPWLTARSVRHDGPQALGEASQQQARTNIAAAPDILKTSRLLDPSVGLEISRTPAAIRISYADREQPPRILLAGYADWRDSLEYFPYHTGVMSWVSEPDETGHWSFEDAYEATIWDSEMLPWGGSPSEATTWTSMSSRTLVVEAVNLMPGQQAYANWAITAQPILLVLGNDQQWKLAAGGSFGLDAVGFGPTTSPNDSDDLVVLNANSPPARLSFAYLWAWIVGKLNLLTTIAGAKNFSGQVRLTGQAATTADAAMTRDLVLGSDARIQEAMRNPRVNFGTFGSGVSGTAAIYYGDSQLALATSAVANAYICRGISFAGCGGSINYPEAGWFTFLFYGNLTEDGAFAWLGSYDPADAANNAFVSPYLTNMVAGEGRWFLQIRKKAATAKYEARMVSRVAGGIYVETAWVTLPGGSNNYESPLFFAVRFNCTPTRTFSAYAVTTSPTAAHTWPGIANATFIGTSGAVTAIYPVYLRAGLLTPTGTALAANFRCPAFTYDQ